MKLGTIVYQHILNIFFERATPICHVTAAVTFFRQKKFFFQSPKYYIPLERYFRADSKEGLPHIKKIISSKVMAILRPNDDVIKSFRKILLLML